MGKLLMIKNADFSAVSVEKVTPGNGYWLYGLTDEDYAGGSNMNGDQFTDGSKVLEDILNKKILKIKTFVLTVGTAVIYYHNEWATVEELRNSTEENPCNVNFNDTTTVYTFNITTTGLYEITFPNPIVIRNGNSPLKIRTQETDSISYMYARNGPHCTQDMHFAWPVGMTATAGKVYENFEKIITFDYYISN